MVTLVGSSAERARLLSVWWPWKLNHLGEVLAHVSSFAIMRQCFATIEVDEWVRRLVHRWYTEARTTLLPRLGLVKPDAYPWERHFTPEWEDCEYQQAGMSIVYRRIRGLGVGVLLGDDVGLGKTPQAIGVAARLFHEKHLTRQRPAVTVTTSSTKSQWKDEIEKFARAPLVVSNIDGPGRVARFQPGADWYILNYEMVYLPQYTTQTRDLLQRAGLVVLDESYKIKNPESQTAQRIYEYTRATRHKIIFNATPIENGLHDLWSQFRVLDARVLGDWSGFDARYIERTEMGKIIGSRNVPEAKSRCAALYLRRTHLQCGTQIPEVVPQVRPVEMTGRQLQAYLAAVRDYTSDTSTGAVAMAKIALVQYAAFAADITNPNSDSAKLDDLEELLAGELKGERVVLFTRFTKVAEFAYRRLTRFRPNLITGGTSNAERSLIRRRFSSQHGVGSLLIGTEAIAYGLNLQEASVAGNLDLPWNSARLRQRVGRIARRGQRRSSVLVLNWKATRPDRKPTIDQYMLGLVRIKRGRWEEFFGDDGVDEIGKDTFDPVALRKYLTG